MAKCEFESCVAMSVARGVCHTHYERLRRHGELPALVRPAKEVRFWSQVDRGDAEQCWEWGRRRDENGYGLTGFGRRSRLRAHRVAFEIANGPIPPGLVICHRCDNPPCCNPSHLFAGTLADNAHDMKAKNRAAHGEQHRDAKLTSEMVIAMRERRAKGETVRSLAKEYGVDESVASRAISGRTWAHIR